MLTEAKWYQILLDIVQCRGADGEGEEGEKKEDEQEAEDEDDEGEDGKKKEGESETDNLVKTLRKERADRKKFERELKQLRAQQQEKEQGETGEAEKARKKAEAAEAKTVKLAGRLRRQAIDMAIAKFAGNMKFRDVQDALVQVERDEEAWVDQDDDDPSEIEVDEKAVEKAVKALADRKKYLLEAEGELEPSGSKFGKGKGKGDEMDEATLRSKYSGLRPQVYTSSTQ